ncbi:hypothetical protein HDU91_004051, partial [Kappamyces sp. JEL0680]
RTNQNSPDNIISNAVLEHEHQLVVKALSGQSQPSEELLDQKNGYEIRMNMLVTMIQLGKLNMPGYVKQVKESIAKTKATALEFKKQGKLELAKQAMVRIKLMSAEVEEVEAGLGA